MTSKVQWTPVMKTGFGARINPEHFLEADTEELKN